MRVSRAVLLAGIFLCAVLACGPASADVKYTSGGLRDPFVERAESNTIQKETPMRIEDAFQSFQLTGIVYAENNPRAMINGRIFSIGDTIQGQAGAGRISRIEKKSVIIEIRDKQVILKLKQTQGVPNENETQKILFPNAK